MTQYKVVSGRYSRLEEQKKGQETRQVRVRYGVGDTFTPTDEEIKKLGKQIEPVQERTRAEPSEPKQEQPEQVESQWVTSKDERVRDSHSEAEQEQPEQVESQAVKHIGGGSYELPNKERVKGKEAAVQRLAELMKEE